ncbi:MAG: RNA polymerase sigma factor SigJ [Chloroflexia bacterium]|nr:RNA polymerase sigma factor SigJ [Chloroflexia bacterium]
MVSEAPGVQEFQSTRRFLFAVAYRMTGSASDAEDLVQDAWLRYLDAGSPPVDSLRAYLTTTVSRLALDLLKSARVRRERYVGPWFPEPVLTGEAVPGPAETFEQREEVSIAFLTLLEQLKPEQRIVYVLREAFGLSYDEIADHIDKSPAACRQSFRRAQLRLSTEHQPAVIPRDDLRQLTERFLAAFTSGNVARVAELLAPDVEWISDAGGQRLAVRRVIVGVDKVARGLAGFARKWLEHAEFEHEIIDLNGSPAIVARYQGKIDRVTVLEVVDNRISRIRNLMNPDKLRYLAESLDAEVATIDERPSPAGRVRT